MCIFPCQVLHNLLNLGDYGSFYTGSLECGLGPGHSGVLRCGLTFPVVSALELNSWHASGRPLKRMVKCPPPLFTIGISYQSHNQCEWVTWPSAHASCTIIKIFSISPIVVITGVGESSANLVWKPRSQAYQRRTAQKVQLPAQRKFHLLYHASKLKVLSHGSEAVWHDR